MTDGGRPHVVVTVHGIRTFATWGRRLRDLLRRADPGIDVESLEYGYFSMVAFSIPAIRAGRVRWFQREITALAKRHPNARIDIVAHSFGTYLVAHGLLGLGDASPPVHTIILSGSVLRSDFPWRELLERDRVGRVINECGISDTALIASQFLVFGTGMAGRLGFGGAIGPVLTNRFHRGGHSLYFKRDGQYNDTFMTEHWVPLFTTSAPPADIDCRREPGPLAGVLRVAIQNATPIKVLLNGVVFSLLVGVPAYAIYQKRVASHEARARQIAAQADVTRDRDDEPARAALLAIESLRLSWTVEGERALRHALDLLPLRISSFPATAEPTAVAISSIGRHIAKATDDVVSVRRVADGRDMAGLRHPGVYAVALSPDGAYAATKAIDVVRIWDLRNFGQEMHRFQSDVHVAALAISPDGHRIVEAAVGGALDVRLRDAATGRLLRHVELPEGYVQAFVFSPDGSRFATATVHALHPAAGGIRVWDARTGREIERLHKPGDATTVAFSPDSRRIAAGYESGAITVWDVESGAEVVRLPPRGAIGALAFSPPPRTDEQILGDVIDEDEPGQLPSENLDGADGRWIASADRDGVVRVWDVSTGRERSRIAGDRVTALAFTGAARLATVREDGAWDVWQSVAPHSAPLGHDDDVLAAAFGCRGKTLLTAGRDGTVHVWDWTTGRRVGRVGLIDLMFMQPQLAAAAFACAPTRPVLAAVRSIAPADEIWLFHPGARLQFQRWVHESAITAIARSQDGRFLASGTENGAVRLLDVSHEQAAETAREGNRPMEDRNGPRFSHHGAVHALAVSRDGLTVAAAGNDGARVWDAPTGGLKLDVRDPIKAIAMDAAGRRLAIVTTRDRIRIWDGIEGEALRAIQPDAPVRAVAVSPAGTLFATAGPSVEVRDLTSGRVRARLADARDVDGILFSEDGLSLVTVSGPDVRVWRWNTDDLVADACTRVGRDLTREEWNQYVGDGTYRATCPRSPSPR